MGTTKDSSLGTVEEKVMEREEAWFLEGILGLSYHQAIKVGKWVGALERKATDRHVRKVKEGRNGARRKPNFKKPF